MSDSETPAARAFDPRQWFSGRFGGHGGRLGMMFNDCGTDWAELALPYNEGLIGDPDAGVIASGPILALMDVAASIAVWSRLGAFKAHATLDLRIDYLRPARPGQTVVGRAECYRVTRSIAFVRGQAHDGDPDDPIAHVAGTFMAVEGYK